ncbi:MAG: DUF7718 family protein [Thermomicrobiales bacterium]
MSERTREFDRRTGDHGDVTRARLTTDRGRVVRYTAQFEVWHDGLHRPAIRYDNAHGFPHRDTLDWVGRTVRKEPMPAQTRLRRLTMRLRRSRPTGNGSAKSS